MNKRICASLLALVVLLCSIAPAALATEVASGTCGEGISWSYANNTLTITGAGDMEDGSPWDAYKDKIENVVFTGGVTKVGANAFENYDRLENIDFGDSMREIGKRAFYDCNDIVELRLPKTFKIFGEESFRNCQMLERVICEGNMPSFKSACLHTGNYISIFYPPNNPWPGEYISPLIGAYGGLLGFMMASEEIMEHGFADSGDAQTEPTGETQAPTEAARVLDAQDVTEPIAVVAVDVTEATVPAETVPATAATEPPATVPETQAPTLAPTEAPTEEPTQAPVETTEDHFLFTQATEPPAEEPKGPVSSSWIGLVMIAAVLTFLLSGAMIFRSTRNRGGRYR